MPSLLRPALCLSLGALLVVAAAFAGTATAQAGVQVVIQPPAGSSFRAISTDDVVPDVTDKTYRVQSGKNNTKAVKVSAGVSVLALLNATGTNTDYATIEIPRSARSRLLLRKEQVENEMALPVFFADAQGQMSFIWPTADGSAIPAENYFPVPSQIFLMQRAQKRLKVEISPSSKKIKPGGTITFRAKTSGDRHGEKVVYRWWLAGKTPRRGGEQHIQDFPEKEGVYRVHVSAVIEGAGVIDRAYAEITVGDPDSKDEEQIGPGDRTTGSETPDASSPAPTNGPVPDTQSTAPVSPPSPTPAPATHPSHPEPADPPDISISGTTVEGNLLADASDPLPTSIFESAAQAAREGGQKNDDGADVSEAALSISGVLALLAIGASIENRQGRRLSLIKPRLRMPRRAVLRRNGPRRKDRARP